MTPSILAGLAGGLALSASGVYLRCRRDMNAARARIDEVERHVVSTRWGAVEYAERGSSDAVLVVHGIFHNCVGGLLSSRDLGEAITVPTLIIHTKDDHVASHEASKRAAERIPAARFVSLESGGHLMLGQMKIVRDELAGFFAERRDRCAEKVAS
jgi:pimeloyl-ACP methyl ester carboxylesterase